MVRSDLQHAPRENRAQLTLRTGNAVLACQSAASTVEETDASFIVKDHARMCSAGQEA